MNRRVLPALVIAGLALSACGGGDDDAAPATSAEPAATAAPGGSTPAAAATECPPAEGADTQTQTFSGPPPDCLVEGVTYDAIVMTNKGEFTIRLDAEQSPIATNNFVFLARNQYYDDTPCHRIIPDFVVQCGDPTGTGTGGPGYTIADEPPEDGQYQIGSVAMAKRVDPDSAGSQFFVITGSSGTSLPPEYALYGQVIGDFETTVESMAAAGTPGDGVPSEPIQIESIRIVES